MHIQAVLGEGTEDDVEDNIAAGVRHRLPGVDDLLLEFIKEGVIVLCFFLLLALG